MIYTCLKNTHTCQLLQPLSWHVSVAANGHPCAVLCCGHCQTVAIQWQLLQSLSYDAAAMEAAFQAIWSCKEVSRVQGYVCQCGYWCQIPTSPSPCSQ
jgi:hypothetical protein